MSLTHRMYESGPPTTVADLKEISSVNIAIAIWNHFNFNNDRSGEARRMSYKAIKEAEWLAVTTKVRTNSTKLPVPKSVAESIDIYTTGIRTQIEDWVAYHFKRIFFEIGTDSVLYCHIPFISWYFNGTINCKQTALNLLSSLRLTGTEKYKFLCTYCLKDEIEEMKAREPFLFDDKFIEVVDYYSHPLIYYWNCYFRNELHKFMQLIPNPLLTLDNYMFKHAQVDNWPAKEYFFDRLSSNGKIRGAILLIDQHGVRYQKLVLQKLNESELARVYMEKSTDIMSNYAKTGKNLGDIKSTWYYIRNLIDLDQFVSIFIALVKAPETGAILTEMWTNVDANSKQYLLNYNDHEVIGAVFQNTNDNDSDFLFTVIAEINASVKKKIIRKPFFSEYCDKLLAKRKIPLFDRLLKECVPIQEVEKLKQHLIINSTYVKETCLNSYFRGLFGEADDLLTVLLPSYPDIIKTYTVDLITSSDGVKNLYHFLDSKEGFLDRVMKKYLRTDDLITRFKKKLINFPSTVALLQSWLAKNRLTDVKLCIGSYITSIEEKTAFKKRLLYGFEGYLAEIFTNYDLAHMQGIQEWCLESEENVRAYKSTLNVDFLFDNFLCSAVFVKYDHLHRVSFCTFQREIDFVPLNLFLKWYFESDQSKIKSYKLRRIYSYRNIDMITTLLNKKDDYYLRQVMQWFFDDDLEEIENFRKKHSGKICYAIPTPAS